VVEPKAGLPWTTSSPPTSSRERRARTRPEENEDLFWAIRGGGGNFGVVTSFEFRLHPVGPEVLAGLIVHPFADTREIAARYRRLVASMPEEMTCWLVFRKAPPLRSSRTRSRQEVLVLAMCYGRSEKGWAWSRRSGRWAS
jgi:FAD/FMN-containing dehydrogenase